MEFVGDDLVKDVVEAAVAGDDVVKDVDEAAVAGDDLVGTLTKERSRGHCLEISRPPPCRVEECGRSHGDTARHTTVARRTAWPASFRRWLNTCGMQGGRWR